MILFAELSSEGWGVIIAAVFLGLAQITSMVLSHLRERDKLRREQEAAKLADDREQAKLKRDEEAAKKTEEVKTDLQTATARQREHLEKQDAALEVIHKATNSLVTKLVEKGEEEGEAKEKAGFAAGRLEEMEKAAAREVRTADRVEGKKIEEVISDAVEKKVDSLHAKVPEKVVEKLDERKDAPP